MFTYCPKCGKKNTVSTTNNTAYVCSDCGWQFWNNPSAAVGLVFVKDGKMLFSKRALEPKKGYYDLPGGFVDFGENAYEAAIREAKEETTVNVQREDLELIDTFHNQYLPDVSTADMIIVVKKWDGELTPCDDSEALEWKDFDFLEDEHFAAHYSGLRQSLEQRFAA